MKRLCFALLVLSIFTPLRADTISVLIHERFPYYSIDDQSRVGGLLGTLADELFKEAGLSYHWRRTAANSQLRRIEANREPVCAIGWFKTPQREAFAQYTQAIYRDKPFVVLVRRDDVRVQGHKRLKDLLADQALTLGKKLGYSYGASIDDEIARLAPKAQTTAQDFNGMLKMLAGNRFDYFFSTAEEADATLKASPVQWKALKTMALEDLPAGNERFILCSRKVSGKAMDALNRVIGEKTAR